MKELAVIQGGSGELHLEEQELENVKTFFLNEKSEATRRAYATDWRCFVKWCEDHHVDAFPATEQAVAGFISEEATRGKSISTITRRLAAIRYWHRMHGMESSATESALVKSVREGIKRTVGIAPTSKRAITASMLQAMVSHCPGSLSGKRDRALLLLTFSSACRRSEIAALTLDDLEVVDRGLILTIRKSKTDQQMAGFSKAIIPGSTPSTCPIDSLNTWLSAADIASGPLFRRIRRGQKITAHPLSGESIAAIVKRYVAMVGLESFQFGAHSLRSGFASSAAEAGASVTKIMEQTGHKSMSSLKRYLQRVDSFHHHAGEGLL